MIRALVPGDEPVVDAFLERHSASSMFLRSNLRSGGIIDQGEPYQGTWFGAFDTDLEGVVCHGWNGMLLLQAPVRLPGLVDAAIAASGRPIEGLSGPWDQVVAARTHLGFTDRATAMDGAEDLFALDLARLVVPDPVRSGRIRVRVAGEADAAWLIDWRLAYDHETLPGLPEDSYAGRAASGLQTMIARGTLFVAEDNGVPVAMSAFNAVLPDMVQIGGVWTPPALRGRGYARSVVAASLVLARDRGVVRSMLFTEPANVAARRAYQAIGYTLVGTYGVVFFIP